MHIPAKILPKLIKFEVNRLQYFQPICSAEYDAKLHYTSGMDDVELFIFFSKSSEYIRFYGFHITFLTIYEVRPYCCDLCG